MRRRFTAGTALNRDGHGAGGPVSSPSRVGAPRQELARWRQPFLTGEARPSSPHPESPQPDEEKHDDHEAPGREIRRSPGQADTIDDVARRERNVAGRPISAAERNRFVAG
jgi:hypothetical protein